MNWMEEEKQQILDMSSLNKPDLVAWEQVEKLKEECIT